jgi:hypothetical protein
MRLVKLLAANGCKHYGARDSSCSEFWESSLVRREWVLNPDYLCVYHPELFHQVLLLPGQGLISNESHSVFGFSSLCMAWNVCIEKHILHYMSQERDMARLARTSIVQHGIFGLDSEEPRPLQLRGTALNFCLTTEAMRMAENLIALTDSSRHFRSCMGPGSFDEYIARMAPAANAVMQFCWRNYGVQLHTVQLV